MKLLEMFVEFAVKGLPTVKDAIDKVSAGFVKMNPVIDGAQKFAGIASAAFDNLKYKLLGVSAVMMGSSSAGQVLGFQFQQISLQIGSLFVPEINRLIEGLQTVVNWFQSLSGSQQQQIANWIKAAAAGLGFAVVLPKIVAGMQLVITSFRALTVALATFNVASGGILTAIGAVGAALGSIGIGSAVAEGGFGALADIFRPLVDLFMSFKDQLLAAIGPLVSLGREVVQAILPVVAAVFDLGMAFMPVLIPAVQALGQMLVAMLLLLKPIIGLFTSLAKLLVNILAPILRVVAGLFGLVNRELAKLVGTNLNMNVKQQSIKGERTELNARAGGFEGIEQTWNRIAAASIRSTMGKTVDEQQLDTLNKIERGQGEMTRAITRIQPAVAR